MVSWSWISFADKSFYRFGEKFERFWRNCNKAVNWKEKCFVFSRKTRQTKCQRCYRENTWKLRKVLKCEKWENRANFPFYNEWKTCKKRKIRGEFHFAFVLWQIGWKSTINWNKFHFYSSFEYCVVKFVENSKTSILFMGRKKKGKLENC